MRRYKLAAIVIIVPLALSTCRSNAPQSNHGRSALTIMEGVALAANACWFKSNDPAFSAYRLAPELNSYAGRPRILIVDRDKPQSLPQLVVQAEGRPARTSVFGPLAEGALSQRIASDTSRWISGEKTCQ